MSAAGAKMLRFGDCELDLGSRELRRAGETVALEPRVLDLLVFLFEQRHRAVDKGEIQEAVWKGLIVSETALTRAIMKARRAVGDSAEKQAVIRTVHGHGYQFVAVPAEAETAPASGAAAQVKRRALAAFVALAIVAFIAFLWPSEAPHVAVRLAILPVDNLTDDPDFEWTRLGLMGFANDLVTRSKKLDIVRPSDVMRFTETRGMPDADDAAAILDELRQVYGASHMLTSRLEKNASVLRLSYSLYKPDGDVDRGTMVGAEPTQLLRGMIRSIGESLGGSTDTSEITVISEDPFINEAFSRGLGFALEGRCDDALQLFEVVMSNADIVGRAHYEWANCARILGRWRDAETAFNEILEQTPAEPSSALRARAHHGLGTVYIRTGRADAARKTLLLGLEEARQANDLRLQGMLLNNLAIEAKNRREFSEARDLLARATVAHSQAGSGIIPGHLPAALANIDMAEGKLEQAEKHLEKALAAFRATGDRRNEAMMLNNMGYLRRLQGRMDEAEPLHLESLAIRKSIGDSVGQGRILGMLSTLYAEAGRYEDARKAADAAWQTASAANDRLFMATSLAQRGQAELGVGDNDAARSSFIDSRDIFRQIDDDSRAAQVTLRLAHMDLQSADFAAANAGADEVLSLALREALHEPMIEALELKGDIARIQGDSGASISAYRDAIRQIDQAGFVERKSNIVIKLITALLEQGNLAASEPLIGYLIEQGDTADSLRIRARYTYQSGDVERSIALLEATQSLAGADWSEADEETLARYREALSK